MEKFCLTNFFEIFTSQKKSQLISAVCLHFFKKNCKSIIFFTTFWELHNCHFSIAICLHFWNQLIYVVIQKCKQMTIFFQLLCILQFMALIFLEFTFFRKNVNKQLKSADFFTETSNFQKSLFFKFCHFLLWCQNIPLFS